MNITDYPIVYTGSVKNVRALTKPAHNRSGIYLFEYTDDYSVFDWGKMPDKLRGKGQAMATLTAFFFEELEALSTWKELEHSSCWQAITDEDFREELKNSDVFKKLQKTGLRTHYRGVRNDRGELLHTSQLRGPTNLVEVDAVNIIRPTSIKIDGRPIWDYSAFRPGMDVFLIPMENVFRYGLPRGSSILERLEYSPDYYRSLGLKNKPAEGDWLPRPIIEYFTKLEPQDRHLDIEQALNYSGLTPELFCTKDTSAYLISLYLIDRFARAGIELWDGKFEFAMNGGLILADAIGPDELRAVKDGVQISKEPIRQYHKLYQAEWYKKIQEAKRIDPDKWKIICKEKFRSEPEQMHAEFKVLCEQMYQALTNALTGRVWFPQAIPLGDVVSMLKKSGIV